MSRLHTFTVTCDDGSQEGCQDNFSHATTVENIDGTEVEARASEAGWKGEWVNVPRPYTRWLDVCPVCWAARPEEDAPDGR